MSRRVAAAFTVLVITASATGCTEAEPEREPSAAPRLTVVVNIFPLRWLAERIGGDLVEVQSIGAEPHEDELSDKDHGLIASADANLFAGNLSPKLRTTLERWRAGRDPKVTVFDISDLRSLDLRPGPDDLGDDRVKGNLDPHFWMDPEQRMPAAAAWVTNQLLSAVTLHDELKRDVDEYRRQLEDRRNRVNDDLAALDRELDDPILKYCAGRVIVPEHPAFQYLADRYGLRQFPITHLLRGTLSPGKAREREAELDRMFGSPARPAFFYAIDKDLNDEERALLTRLASEYVVTPGSLDSLEQEPTLTGPDDKRITDYLEAMRVNARNIAREFDCG